MIVIALFKDQAVLTKCILNNENIWFKFLFLIHLLSRLLKMVSKLYELKLLYVNQVKKNK